MALHAAKHHSSGQLLPFRESLTAMLGICFVIVLVALDQTVVGTALPTIVSELKGFDLYAWVATSCLLATVVTVPIFGRLGDHYGRKPFVIASITVFTVASALCGLAFSMPFLLVARSLQGIGGGMLFGTVFACVADLFPSSVLRLRWQVMLSSALGISNAIGPSLGGLLTQYYGWRSVFYVNLPIGLLSLFFVWRFLPYVRQRKHRDDGMRIDWPGAALIAITLGAVQLFVELVSRIGLSSISFIFLIVGMTGGVALFRWEKNCAYAMLPTEMFRNASLFGLFKLAIFAGFTMFSLLLYVPLLFQGGFGMSPKDSGLFVTPLVVFITIGSILNGRVVTRVTNPNVMLFVGFALLAISCAGSALTTSAMPRQVLLAFMLVGGMGFGFVMPNLTVFAQQAAGREHLGIASALLQSLRMLGGMVGTALIGTIVRHAYSGRVRLALGKCGASRWTNSLGDPQILVNRSAQRALLSQVADAGQRGELLLNTARHALVDAIHVGLTFAAAIALIAVWQACRVPRTKLGNPFNPLMPAE
ncbi:MFS transporter [Paraburkholderia sp. D1E]|uniref:MFS transporter n=1 Tax=Paraburkholderia sp. D1E TaxID=3461398 RepID=UPI00404594D4